MRERRRNVVTVLGLYWGSRLLSLGAGVGTGLGLKSAGWTFLPTVAVAVAVLLGVYRVLSTPASHTPTLIAQQDMSITSQFVD
jgi:hypothetical protein